MQKKLSSKLSALLVLFALLLVAGCGSKTDEPVTSTDSSGKTTTAGGSRSPGLIDRITSKPITVPAGTVITVRLGEALGSKLSQSGQSFSATVAQPVEVGGKVVIPSGAAASGTVVDAKALGKFKGGAVLRIQLDSVTVGGKNYALQTADVSRALKGKGKRTATMIGGGAGAGALIGALAGGGKGAAIGAAVGAGAGTAGAAYTGNKDIVLPAESAISFKTLESVDINQ